MYRINEIKLNIDDDKSKIVEGIRRRLKKPGLTIDKWEVVRESIDARKKHDIKLVYTVDFSCKEELDCPEAPDLEYTLPEKKNDLSHSPIVIGFGPCGIFAALILAEAGYKPIVLERGKTVEERTKDVIEFWETGKLNLESNVQFGEGGAGTFSDGKLTTGIKDKRIRKVLEELSKAGGGKEILYKQKPHIGTDLLKQVVKKLREKIIEKGGKVIFNAKVEKIKKSEDGLINVGCANGETLASKHVILATGHSARDVYELLHNENVSLEQKPFSMGVRIEHSQELINKAQYKDAKLAKKLGPAEYKLSHRCKNGRGVYTFCMCPGGEVIMAASEEGTVVTNGMSYNSREGKFANSGLLVDVRTSDYGSDHVLAGIEFQRKYEKLAYINGEGKAPMTRWKNFEKSKVAASLPDFARDSIIEAMPYLGNKLRGFDDKDATCVGVETRSSSPVRVLRNEELSSSMKGLYPAGEGAGYAGGIVSAAVDGMKVAEKIISD